MVERLAQFREAIDPASVPFLNDRMVPILRSNLAAAVGGRQQLGIRFQLGRQLVQAGFPEEGIAQYDAMEAMMAQLSGRVVGQGMSDLRMSRAIALLRVGEQENCLERHNPDSCVFPIQSKGVHALQRGSRGAIAVLTEQLQSNPNDLAARWLLNVASMTLGEWPDKVPSAWVIPPKLLESEYDIHRFPDVAAALGLDLNDLAGGCVLDDMDNDDRLDVVVSTWGLDGPLRYFHNDGNGRFADRTAEAGLTGLVSGLNLQQTDYNNAGWLDFYLATGDPDLSTLIPNRMFRNAGGTRFQEVTTSGGFGNLQKGHVVAFADLDHDGDQDVYAVIGGALAGDRYRKSLFLNPGHGHRWLKLHCVGQRSNRAAIGTRIQVTVETPAGWRVIHKTVNSGGSFGSSPLRQEIGLGDATAIVCVDLLWPASGLCQTFGQLHPDRAYRVIEGEPEPLELSLSPIPFPTAAIPVHTAKSPVAE